MSKNDRQNQVAALTDRLKDSKNIYVTDFTGLSVGKITELRRKLRAAGARYVVVKNTLAQRALAANAIRELDDHLAGPTGLVLAGTDPLAAAKVLGEFAKENQKPQARPSIRPM
jgi:large subunit ribosomal protein L10